MTAYGDMGSQLGIRALENGFAIGGKMRFYVGSGTPAATFSATEVGDLYLDYTNAVLYIASATGTGSWTAYAGLSTMASGATIGGVSFFSVAGTPVGVTTALRIGDIAFDYTNGQVYVANATGTGGWVLVGGGPAGTATVQVYSTVITLATLQAGATILPAVTGLSYTILGYKISTASGTPAGTGNFVLEDSGATQVALTASVAQLAAASSPGAAIGDTTYTLATIGAYTGKKMTAAHGVIFPAMASLTGPYTMQIQVAYILTA
jgi:hypothetical protein